MITGLDIVQEARTWIGTPFHHAAKVKGVGVDCLGLLLGIADHFNIPYHWENYGYGQDNIETLVQHLSEACNQVDDLQPGDVPLFRVERRLAHHLGIYVGHDRFIHAYDSAGIQKVIESPLSGHWHERLHSIWRIKGVGPSQA